MNMYINVNQFLEATCDSDMIQAAVDAAQNTGQAVLIPRINARTGQPRWDITKTILLPSNCMIFLQNCHMRLADGAVCSIFQNKDYEIMDYLSEEKRQKNITIQGIGQVVLDGGVHNGIYEHNGIARKVMKKSEHSPVENCMIRFRNVKNLTIDGLTVRNQRYWGIPLSFVTYSHFSNIRFESEGNVPNQDGLDICKGCHDIIVENITGCTGDNLIAICAIGGVDNKSGINDIYNVTVRNVVGYGVGGCALIRILNHDGNKIYNIHIDTVIEASPWSDDDAALAPNPDLLIKTDDEGNIIPWRRVKPGEYGYRQVSIIQIGELYWYKKTRAEHGDTYGITVKNVMTHARFAIEVNNTLLDSSFENIRMFGNGYMAAYFGEGQIENIHLRNITYDCDCHPMPEDEHIYVEWNKTRTDGYHCIAFNGTKVKNLNVDGLYCATEGNMMAAVFGGHGSGNIRARAVQHDAVSLLSEAEGIEINQEG